MHDLVTGIHSIWQKEELQKKTEEQIAVGEDSLEESDKYLLEINLEDLGATPGVT